MMTSKERFLAAIRNGQADRVPVAPDISCMIPTKRTGKPSWDVNLFKNPPLWKAYLEAAGHFGFDAWFTYGKIDYKTSASADWRIEHTYLEDEDRMFRRATLEAGGKTFTKEDICPRSDPPTPVKKIIDDFADDWPKIKNYLFPDITGYSSETFELQREAVGDSGVFGVFNETPGISEWFHLMAGGLEATVFALTDYPELFEELMEIHRRNVMQRLEIICELKPDFVLLGSSGSITMASPELYRKWSLPSLKAQTRMCAEAGIPTMLHSCGKEYDLVKMSAEETDLNCINPLEIPPMGDCVLARVKKDFGDRISLMGNIHTTDVMLNGTVEEVENAARKAIDDAGENGGFILSTGDQCGRDTPDENIFALIRTAHEYGKYC